MLKDIKSGLIISATFLFVVGLVSVSYAALSSLKVVNGNNLSSSLWNDLVDHSVPSGAINAFYLASCPIGWKAADGTNSTPDLRGQFLRGLNDFGTGLRTDGNENPEIKALGDYQADDFKSHNHQIRTIRRDSDNHYAFEIAGEQRGDSNSYDFTSSSLVGGNETRPKNVSVIFCIKE